MKGNNTITFKYIGSSIFCLAIIALTLLLLPKTNNQSQRLNEFRANTFKTPPYRQIQKISIDTLYKNLLQHTKRP